MRRGEICPRKTEAIQHSVCPDSEGSGAMDSGCICEHRFCPPHLSDESSMWRVSQL
jgi:hypothetical protein